MSPKSKQPSFRIFSFYKKNVNPRVVRYQQAVFRKFGFRIHYITDESFSHGDFLNHVCRTVTDVDYLIFFDVDCIPVHQDWLTALLKDLREPDTVAGAAQTANHLRDAQNLYVSPFFLGISTAYLKRLGYPDMNMTEDMDAGQPLSELVSKSGGRIVYWWPTHIEDPQWYLHHPEHKQFGPGTTYNEKVYHAFLSRFDLSERFILKCKSVLAGTFYGFSIGSLLRMRKG